jgi:hypothetical protein
MAMSMREYAKHRGVSVVAVHKAVKSGRITCERDANGYAKIDPKVADAQWLANSDFTKIRGDQVENEDEIEGPAEEPAPAVPADKYGHAYRASRAVKETYASKLAKIEYEKSINKLVEIDEVKRVWLDRAAKTKQQILSISMKMKKHHKFTPDLQAVLDEIIQECLEGIANSSGVS